MPREARTPTRLPKSDPEQTHLQRATTRYFHDLPRDHRECIQAMADAAHREPYQAIADALATAIAAWLDRPEPPVRHAAVQLPEDEGEMRFAEPTRIRTARTLQERLTQQTRGEG